MQGSRHIHIGTSGWHYKHWKGPFYQQELPDREMLARYAESFRTAEINNSYYRLPEKQTFLSRRKTMPKDFVFAVKASRFITHMKKLKDRQEPLQRFFERTQGLKGKLGPVLITLGIENRALGFVGGFTGDELEGRLLNEGIACDFVRIAGEGPGPISSSTTKRTASS